MSQLLLFLCDANIITVGNIHEISKSVRCKNRKKKKKGTLKKKIIQDNIYVVQQFAYVDKVVVIHYFQGKIQDAIAKFFSLQTTH